MANYGEMLDFYDPHREGIYKVLLEYFGNLEMTKIKSVNNYSMYAAKIYSGLINNHKYVIVFVHEDNLPINTVQTLSDLKWDNLQTRLLPYKYDIKPQSYVPRRLPSLMTKIYRSQQHPDEYIYYPEDSSLMITLLPQKDSSDEYQQRGSILTAIETYSTIISFP